MPLDRLITVRITEIVGGDDPTDPTAPVPGGGENILREEEVWGRIAGQQSVRAIHVRRHGDAVQRDRRLPRSFFVDWLADARATLVQVPDRQDNFVDLEQIREDTKSGRRRYLILEGKAFD